MRDRGLTPLQQEAFEVIPSGRNAYRQLFIENAPEDTLGFCVSRYKGGTEDERYVISYLVNTQYFGFSHGNRTPYWATQDKDLCEVFQNCFDLVAVAAPYLPLKMESAFDLISAMPENMRRQGIPITRENQRTRFLVNVLTYRLLSRTVIHDSYRQFIRSNREEIEKNLDVILDRKLYQPSDIRAIISAHPVLVEGVL